MEKPVESDPTEPRAQTWRPGRLTVGLGIAAAAIVLWLGRNVFLLLFAAILLAVFLRAVSDWIKERTPLSHGWSLGLVAVALPAIVVGFIALIAPRVGQQVEELTTRLPEIIDQATADLRQYDWAGRIFERDPGDFLSSGGAIFGRVIGAFEVTITGLIYSFFFVLIGLYLAAEAERYRDGLIQLLPSDLENRARDVLEATVHTLRWWLLGQMVSMAVLGVASFIGLSLFDIPLAFSLALFTAILTFIPTLGPAISAIPPLLLALPGGGWKVFYVLVFWTVMQVGEGSFLTPMVQRRAVEMPPALLLSMQVLASAVLGFWGLVLAAPMTAAGMMLIRKLYIEGVLEKRV